MIHMKTEFYRDGHVVEELYLGGIRLKFTIFFAKCIFYICDEAAIFLCDLEEFYPPKTAGKVDRRWFTDFTE